MRLCEASGAAEVTRNILQADKAAIICQEARRVAGQSVSQAGGQCVSHRVSQLGVPLTSLLSMMSQEGCSLRKSRYRSSALSSRPVASKYMPCRRRGAVWCGVVRCGVVWCGAVWCGAVWCGAVRCGVVWCGVVWGCRGVQQQLMQQGWVSARGCSARHAACLLASLPACLAACGLVPTRHASVGGAASHVSMSIIVLG